MSVRSNHARRHSDSVLARAVERTGDWALHAVLFAAVVVAVVGGAAALNAGL